MADLRFHNGQFKIMQITDTQEHYFVNPDTIKLIRLALEREKPDLVVFTGDQIAGYSPTFFGNTMEKITKTLNILLQPLDELGIPFCMTFGNHDNNCGIENKAQMPIYETHPTFVFGNRRSDDDPGTLSLTIKNESGEKDVFALYLFDSGGKLPDGSYDAVKPEQIKWFRFERDRLEETNGALLPSLVFQHIPLPEYFSVLKQVPKSFPGAVEAFFDHADEFYVLPDEALDRGDFMYESPAAPAFNTGEFDALKEKNDVLGVYCGHDHYNSFVLPLDGIDLGYTQGSGFHVYGPGKQRGVRIFTLHEDDPRHYETYTVTMDELSSEPFSEPWMEFILTHMPTSFQPVIRTAKRIGIAAAGIAAAAAVLRLSKKK